MAQENKAGVVRITGHEAGVGTGRKLMRLADRLTTAFDPHLHRSATEVDLIVGGMS